MSGCSRVGEQTSTTATPRTIRILLVEDNEINQRVAAGLLRKQGHEVTIASDGRIALDLFRTDRFDMIFMDVQMPRLNGLEATAEIRRIEESEPRERTPIIAMTARTLDEDREHCLASGMDSYLSKPIRTSELMAAVARFSAGGVEPPPRPPAPQAVTGLARDLIAERFLGDSALFRDFLERFLLTLPAVVDDVRHALAQNDVTEVFRLVHSFKGTVGLFGSTTAYHTTLELEHAARQGNLADANTCFHRLEPQLEELGKQLQTIETR